MIEIKRAASIRRSFDMIEEAYEFMLAYAAQGRRRESADGGGTSQIRHYLQRFRSATVSLVQEVNSLDGEQDGLAFRRRFVENLLTVQSVLDMLLAQPSISSEMIDNTNGMIVMRSALTEIFFADHVMLPPR